MARKYRCYHCGFETPDMTDFTGYNGDGDTHWMMFICPQCAVTPPPVAEVSHDAAPKLNKWELVEADDGLRVKAPGKKGGCSISPMHPKHPLFRAPASLLRPELEGTMLDHSKALRAVGKANSERFHAELRAWDEEHPRGTRDERIAYTDERRKINEVGPHSTRVNHDGATLMKRAGLMGRY
jgi:hypothetical protein